MGCLAPQLGLPQFQVGRALSRGMILPLGSWDMSWSKHLGYSWAQPWGAAVGVQSPGLHHLQGNLGSP